MEIKVCIGLPTNRGLKPKCLETLMGMVNATDVDLHIVVSTKGYNCAENRNYIVAQAMRANCTHLLLLDDDMIYEPDSINRLLAHNKDVVGAKYSVRRIVESGNHEVIEYGEDEKSDTELFKCDALGGGLLLINTDVFRKVSQPHFGYKWHDNGMVEMSNDWFFCEKAREVGYDIWCDPTVKAGHIGQYEY